MPTFRPVLHEQRALTPPPKQKCSAGGIFSKPQRWVSTSRMIVKTAPPGRPLLTPHRTSTALPELGTRIVTSSGHKGTVRYRGETRFKPGLWLGLELDGAHGKNDGSIQGVRYFYCPPLHGVFVSPGSAQPLKEEIDEAVPKRLASSCSALQANSPCSYVVLNTDNSHQVSGEAAAGAPCTKQTDLPEDVSASSNVQHFDMGSKRRQPLRRIESYAEASFYDAMTGSPGATSSMQHLSEISGSFQQQEIFAHRMSIPDCVVEESISLCEDSGLLNECSENTDVSDAASNGLQDLYNYDWSDPNLFDDACKCRATSQVPQVTDEAQLVVKSCADERGCHQCEDRAGECPASPKSANGGSRPNDALAHAVSEEEFRNERQLLLQTIESLRVTAEAAIVRAEAAESQLRAHCTEQQEKTNAESCLVGASALPGEDLLATSTSRHQAMSTDLKYYIETEVKCAVDSAVQEATTDIRAAAAEALLLRDRLCPDIERLEQIRLGDTTWQEQSRSAPSSEDQHCEVGDCKSELLSALKEASSFLSEHGADSHEAGSPSSTDDGGNFGSRSTSCSSGEAGSASGSCSSKSSSPCLTPRLTTRESRLADCQHSAEENLVKILSTAVTLPAESPILCLEEAPLAITPSMIPATDTKGTRPTVERQPLFDSCVDNQPAAEPQHALMSCGLHCDNYCEPIPEEEEENHLAPVCVRDVVNQFERATPTLTPWPFAAVNRPKSLTTAVATPWSTSPIVRSP